MGNSSSAAARSVGWLRFALVVLVCLVFGLVLGYSATPAVRWLGKRIAVAETSRSAVVSPASRRTEPDNLRALSSVRTGTHQGEHWESKTHWDYCGNPQCRLCYPVAGAFASDLPDMPQGYCKRHPQSRDCKPIVVPAPKPLPKATDPPIVASAGLGARDTLSWVLMLALFVGLCAAAFDAHELRKQLATADKLLGRLEIEASEVRQIVQSWLDKQGHDRCWYYPEIFAELARALDLRGVKPPQLPSLAEFKAGCERYQREQYSAALSAMRSGNVTLKPQDPTYEHLSHETVIPEAARCDQGDLCSLHKPCAKHESKRISCGIVSVNNDIDVECAETALGYIRSGDAVCIKHAKDFQIDRLVEPFPPEYLGLSIERDRLSLRAQQQFQTLASATSSMSLGKAQQPANSDERGTDKT